MSLFSLKNTIISHDSLLNTGQKWPFKNPNFRFSLQKIDIFQFSTFMFRSSESELHNISELEYFRIDKIYHENT